MDTARHRNDFVQMTTLPRTLNSSRQRIGRAVMGVKLNEAHRPGNCSQLRDTPAAPRVPVAVTQSRHDAAARTACKRCGGFGVQTAPATCSAQQGRVLTQVT